MKLHDYMLDRLLVPNPKRLTPRDKKELLETFGSLEKVSFKSVTEQFRNGDENRKTIDKAWLTFLEYEGDHETFLMQLYKAILEEIKIINQLMPQQKAFI